MGVYADRIITGVFIYSQKVMNDSAPVELKPWELEMLEEDRRDQLEYRPEFMAGTSGLYGPLIRPSTHYRRFTNYAIEYPTVQSVVPPVALSGHCRRCHKRMGADCWRH
jgi:hypothetical protein